MREFEMVDIIVFLSIHGFTRTKGRMSITAGLMCPENKRGIVQ